MKSKKIFLILLGLVLTLCVKAQDKYQFMIIEYSTLDTKIAVSIDGREYYTEEINFENITKSGYNANPLLGKIKKYQDENWEVMSFNTQVVCSGNGINKHSSNCDEIFFAYLRRKVSY